MRPLSLEDGGASLEPHGRLAKVYGARALQVLRGLQEREAADELERRYMGRGCSWHRG
jgi:hypothetical protein